MQSLTLWMQVSFDGYACGPDGAFDWPVVGPELNQDFVDELGSVSRFLYGRTVFEMMAVPRSTVIEASRSTGAGAVDHTSL